ncbi:MAG TPA: 3-hydroxyacyl-CoA dehydrogenase NAD-binding domain-containing protein, partial [Rhizomicrobium sp.]
MALERIGIIGAGQMGTGIAHVLALAGYDVVLDDINKDALGKALERIEKNMQRQAAKGAITEAAIKPALAHIRTTTTLDDLRDRELVIEAATEDESIKKKIFQELAPRLNDKAMV